MMCKFFLFVAPWHGVKVFELKIKILFELNTTIETTRRVGIIPTEG